jgi:hypothetical protein
MARRDPEIDEPQPMPTEMGETDPLVLDDSPKNPKESDPLPESEWAPAAPERPYSEAITPEHREELASFGIRIPEPEK